MEGWVVFESVVFLSEALAAFLTLVVDGLDVVLLMSVEKIPEIDGGSLLRPRSILCRQMSDDLFCLCSRR